MIVLRGGTLHDPLQGWNGPADVCIENARVHSIRRPGDPPPPGPVEVWDVSGLDLIPGPIDALCYCDVGRDPWREDLARMAEVAAAGGFTGLLVYTGTADPDVVAALAAQSAAVRVFPVAAATVQGRITEMHLLREAGAVALSDAPEPVGDAGLMRRVLEYSAGSGLPVVVCPRDLALSQGGVMHEGAWSLRLGLRGVPSVAEAAAVCRDVLLRRAFGGRLHFAALSSRESLEHLDPDGDVTAAVTAHHLALTDEAVRGYDTAAKLDPPLRGEADREALLQAARAGRLTLVSGHRPRPPETKACEYDYASFGAPALATALHAAYGLLGPAALAAAAAAAPAKAFRLPGGTLRPGAPADLTAFDPSARGAAAKGVPPADPLAGREFTGAPALTLVGGRPVHAAEGLRIKMQKAREAAAVAGDGEGRA